MPIKILMPALSPTMTSGTLVRWHKGEGDPVKSGQLLAEIETDKATMELEAIDDGVLAKIIIPEGTENVAVNTLIALILEEGEAPESLNSVLVESPSPVSSVSEPALAAPAITPAPKQHESASGSGRLFASPLARRLADQKGIELHTLTGSGPHGRIVKADVEKASPVAVASAAALSSPASYTDVKLTGMRKVIAARLTESKQTIPHFYLTIDCALDALLQVRQQFNGAPKASVKLSVNDFIIRAIALALKDVPEANAAWQETSIRLFHQSDVAVAVAIDGGLVTPVIRDAANKSLRTLSQEMKTLAEQARAGKLPPEAYQGGTFTLSNLGMFGIQQFGAIINPPQACILAVGAGEKRAIIKNDQLAIATMMTCTLSVDHRAVDGAVGARFLSAFKEYIEAPLELLA